MKNIAKRLIAVIASAALLFGLCCTTASAEYQITDVKVNSADILSEENAYIIFSKKPQEHLMSFIRGSEDINDELYSEEAVFDGLECRQVYVQNKFYMKFDPSFAKPEDNQFLISLDYWDYGSNGSFDVEYTTDTEGHTKKINVPKTGVHGSGIDDWHRINVIIGDACFTQSMDHNSDIRILSRAYNAYTKIEVVNLSGKANTTEHLGVFNTSQARSFKALGLFDGIPTQDGTFNSGLERELDYETALYETVKLLGFEKEAIKQGATTTIANVSSDKKALVGYAQKIGLTQGISLDAKATLTQRQLLRIYLNAVGADAAEGTEKQAAEQAKVLKGENLVFQMDKNANYDNMIGVARNTLLLCPAGSKQTFLNRMMTEEIVDGNQLADTGDTEYVDSILKGEVKMPPEERIDPVSGRKYYILGLFGQNALKGYYTAQMWAPDCKRFYIADDNGNLYEYNIETYMLKYLDELSTYNNYQQYCMSVAKDINTLFYINRKNEIMKMDVATYEKSKVADPPIENNPTLNSGMNMLEVMDTGEKLSVSWAGTPPGYDYATYHNIRTWFPLLDVKTGQWDTHLNYSFPYTFDTDWRNPNHNSINPVNPNLMFFAHEGTGPNNSGIFDRVWCIDIPNDNYVNSIKQEFFETGIQTGGVLCHEGWLRDGKRLFAVKNTRSWNLIYQGIGPSGLVISNWDNTERYFANGDYFYNHMGASIAGDRWFTGDTQFTSEKFNHLILIDSYTGESFYLAQVDTTGQNPGHTHPQFSPNDQYVTFGAWSSDLKHVRTCWMDISDITEKARETWRKDISDSCEITSATGLKHEVRECTDNGVTYYSIPVGNHMKVNAKSSAVYEKEADVKITIEYLDEGYLPFKVNYCTWHVLPVHNRLFEESKLIERNNTKQWKTATFTVKKASMDNMQLLGTDFSIEALKNEVKIKSVEVEKLS